MFMRSYLIAGLLLVVAGPALAERSQHRDRSWHASIFAQTWIETRLPLLPYNVVTGNINFENTHILAGAVSYVPVRSFDIPVPGTGYALRGNSLEIEGQLVKHFGRQNHVEATAALVLRSGEVPITDNASFNVAWGNGLSYAFADPAFERGGDGVRGADTRRLQYYMGFETEFTHRQLSNFHVVTRLHHRSGIYGLISPQRTGSNFVGVGLRWDIQ